MEPTRQVAFTAIELTRSPNMVTAEDLRGPSGDSSRPQQLLKVMKTTTITIIYQLYIYIYIYRTTSTWCPHGVSSAAQHKVVMPSGPALKQLA